MESLQKLRRQQTESHMMMTLNKQIEALNPIRVSYDNLVNYHQKVSIDLASLIDQHDYALTSLKSNLQNLTAILMRAQTQKNDLNIEFKDRQNQMAKLILDTRNFAQKYQSLNQKLQLQGNRTDQNISYKNQLLKIYQTLKAHIVNTQNINKQLIEQQLHLKQQQTLVIDRIQNQETKRQQQLSKSQVLKSSIARANIQNDDMIDGNRKLNQQIRNIDDQCMIKSKINRQFKEKLIQKKSTYQKIKNQILYKLTLLQAQEKATIELNNHQAKLQHLISETQTQKSLVKEQNTTLETQLDRLQKEIKENLAFKLNAESHLTQLKQTNQMLLSKMEQYCLQDRQIENLLLKKMQSLDFFAQILHQKYQSQQISKVQSFNKDSVLLNSKNQNTKNFVSFEEKLFKFEKNQSIKTKNQTNGSQKSWKKQAL